MNKHNLDEVVEICMTEVTDCHIIPGNIVAYKVNPRLRQAWGRCVRLGRCCTIELQPFLLDSRTPLVVLKQVIIHEILHSCDGCHNHGLLWKSYADRINARYGYHIARLVNAEERKLCNDAGTFQPEERFRYVMECGNCHVRSYKSRICNFVRYPEGYICKKCGSQSWTRIR